MISFSCDAKKNFHIEEPYILIRIIDNRNQIVVYS